MTPSVRACRQKEEDGAAGGYGGGATVEEAAGRIEERERETSARANERGEPFSFFFF